AVGSPSAAPRRGTGDGAADTGESSSRHLLGRFWGGQAVRDRSRPSAGQEWSPRFLACLRTVEDGGVLPCFAWHSRGRGFDSLRLHSCHSISNALAGQIGAAGVEQRRWGLVILS